MTCSVSNYYVYLAKIAGQRAVLNLYIQNAGVNNQLHYTVLEISG